MHPVVQQLKELTEVDALLVQTREQLARYPQMLAKLDRAEADLRRRAEQAQAQQTDASRRRREAEREVKDLRERQRRTQNQQAMVKTEKEAAALTHELDNLQARIDELEMTGLEALDQEETQAAARAKAEAELARLVAEHAPERARIAEQTEEKRERQTRLASEQARRFAQLPDDWQQTYELMNQRLPGSVAAPLQGGQCGGCHYQLVAHTRQLVAAGQQVVQCDHCRRVLFIE